MAFEVYTGGAMRPTMKTDYGDEKFSKATEINEDMTITASDKDELTQKLFGGNVTNG